MRVYVAGPITLGPMDANIRLAIDAAHILMNHGFEPFVPHLTFFQQLVHAQTYERWIKYDNAFLEVCAALLRLSGESKGADGEEAYARKLGIPVFYSIADLIAWRDNAANGPAVHR